MIFKTMEPNSFGSLVKQHNRNIKGLHETRKLLAPHAETLAKMLVNFYPVSKGVKCYWKDDPDGKSEGTTGHIAKVLRHESASVNYGNKNVFDPWDGFWRGNWCSSGKAWPQYHIWDRTRATSDGKHFVQPVSQRGLAETKACSKIHDDPSEFVDAGNLKAQWEKNAVNLAINVWSNNDKVTGWVWKKQGGKPVIMPHLGYRLNDHTLIWIAQEMEFKGVDADYTMNKGGRFFMFFEWVGQCRRAYGIHGREFTIAGLAGSKNGTINVTKPIGSTTRYVLDRSIGKAVQQKCSAEPLNFCTAN